MPTKCEWQFLIKHTTQMFHVNDKLCITTLTIILQLSNYGNRLTFTETSSTRFLLLGSSNVKCAVIFGTPITIRPRIVPFSLILFVSSLVSIPYIPGIPFSRIHWDRVLTCRQWLGVSHNSPTIKPAAHMRWDSNHLQLYKNDK